MESKQKRFNPWSVVAFVMRHLMMTATVTSVVAFAISDDGWGRMYDRVLEKENNCEVIED